MDELRRSCFDGKITFTDWHTVKIYKNYGTTEMYVEDFISTLDSNIESCGYGVSYDPNKGFKMDYNYDRYHVVLNKNMKEDKELNMVYFHLLMLSKVKEYINANPDKHIVGCTEKEIKKFYLSILKNKSGSIKRYFSNLKADLVKSFANTIDDIRMDCSSLLPGTIVAGTIAGAIIWCIVFILFGCGIEFKLASALLGLGVALCSLEFAGIYIKNQIEKRIDRARTYFYLRKQRKTRLKSLKKELSTNKNLCIEDKKNVVEIKKDNIILTDINELIELSEGVPIDKRHSILNEINELTNLYYEKIKDSNKEDREIMLECPEILSGITRIKLEISSRSIKEGNIQRQKLVESTLERIISINSRLPQTESDTNEVQKGLHL